MDLVWSEWEDFDDTFEYYVFKSGSGLFKHNGLAVRRADTGCTLIIDLSTNDEGWYTFIRRGKWEPGEIEVNMSENKWNPAMVAFALHTFSKNFSAWNLLFNNCRDFTSGLKEFMRENHRDCVTQAKITSFDDLRKRAQTLNLQLLSIESSDE